MIIIGLVLITLIYFVNMVRKHQLDLRYALSWFAVGVAILLMACFPGIMDWLARLIGIASPVNMLFFFGFVFTLILVFVLTYSVSRMSNRIKVLTQELAMLKKEMNDRK